MKHVASERDDLQESLESAAQERSSLTEQLAQLEGAVESQEREIERYREERSRLAEDLESVVLEKNYLSAGIAEAGAQRAALQKELTDAKQILTSLSGEVSQLSEKQLALSKELSELEAEKYELACQLLFVRDAWAEFPVQQPPSYSESPVADRLDCGVKAYRNRHYKLAYATWGPLAEDNVRRAQFYMGGLYYEGRGTNADPARSYYWLTLADKAGYPLAGPLLNRLQAKLRVEDKSQAETWLAAWQATGAHPNGE